MWPPGAAKMNQIRAELLLLKCNVFHFYAGVIVQQRCSSECVAILKIFSQQLLSNYEQMIALIFVIAKRHKMLMPASANWYTGKISVHTRILYMLTSSMKVFQQVLNKSGQVPACVSESR